MMLTKKSLASAIATGALLFGAFVPSAFADTTLSITGNGEASTNTTNISSTNTTSVSQSNNANVSNNIDTSANTGGNQSNGNTGGSVTVHTGDATSASTVSNTLNSNQASVANCGSCNGGGASVTTSGNGENSTNGTNLGLSNQTLVNQTNTANVTNDVHTRATTGGNDATSNTGGSVSITTGAATATSNVSTAANANVAQVGSGTGAGNGTLSAVISGNGENSNNRINLGVNNSAWVSQTNNADITNDVDAHAYTGDNQSNGNTGGSVTVHTGDATANATVNNLANFNAASLDCGCMLGVSAAISGNGEYSHNNITADELTNLSGIDQSNGCFIILENGYCIPDIMGGIDNNVDAHAGTGQNDSTSNTGWLNGATTVTTGAATNDVHVNNTGNANVAGPSLTLPTLGGSSVNVNFSLNLSQLLSMLGIA